MSTENFRAQFNEAMDNLFDNKGLSSTNISENRYKFIVNRLEELAVPDTKKDAKDYRLLKKYDLSVTRVGDIEVKKLIRRGSNLLFLSESE